ncbi:MAG TPA: hemerythrin domain-containing protein [Noviherbaspirillum sp.]|uniref:hemerythrin domain-containing protein n=1 Tax=Noviherbaspirillum sp. TaxID=1926288 RepID=UPI002B493B0E|nr:hemerythrin domain-containing protein [Noviherbaspirillum sp.]HJV84520.1 hemerythrin domain-containing protein [Noviherbaspirillum sp.]
MTNINAEFRWNDLFLLGYAPMDQTHREFVDVVQGMLTAKDDEMPDRLAAFIRHAEEHFDQEHAWMAETAFPARQCHADEHDAVLASAYEVQDLIASGREAALARELAKALVNWFPGHADYMDASLAQWMSKKRLGGTPVVLKRGVVQAE